MQPFLSDSAAGQCVQNELHGHRERRNENSVIVILSALKIRNTDECSSTQRNGLKHDWRVSCVCVCVRARNDMAKINAHDTMTVSILLTRYALTYSIKGVSFV